MASSHARHQTCWHPTRSVTLTCKLHQIQHQYMPCGVGRSLRSNVAKCQWTPWPWTLRPKFIPILSSSLIIKLRQIVSNISRHQERLTTGYVRKRKVEAIVQEWIRCACFTGDWTRKSQRNLVPLEKFTRDCPSNSTDWYWYWSGSRYYGSLYWNGYHWSNHGVL